MAYRTIVADPPWDFRWNGTGQWPGARRNGKTGLGYGTMSLTDILDLPVSDLAMDDAALFLWVPSRLNREGVGVAVARAWDFEPTSEFIWSKGLRLGGGFPRICHEVVLVCKRGEHAFRRSPWVDSVQAWRRIEQDARRHSTKPDGFLDLVEQYSDGPYVELFARRHRLGWDVWGDQSANTAPLAV